MERADELTNSPDSLEDIVEAAARTRFAWGESGYYAREEYIKLMNNLGYTETEALEHLGRFSSLPDEPGRYEAE